MAFGFATSASCRIEWGKPEVVYSARGAAVRDRLGIGEGHVTLTDEAGLVVARRGPDAARACAVNTLVFDIETVPDTALGRRLYGLHDVSDEQVGEIMFTKRRQETGSDFLSHEQHRVVAISVVMRSRDTLKVWSLGDEKSIGEGFDRALLRRSGQIHAGSRVLERRRIRSAGAALSQPAARRDRGALLGDRRARHELPIQQLPEPLSLAAHGSDGHPVGLPGARPREPRRYRDAARLPGKVGMHGADVWGAYLRGGSRVSAPTAKPTCSTPI
jgi:hypothetical protein